MRRLGRALYPLRLFRLRRALDEAVLVLVREVFQCALLRLGDEERREDTRQHEEREDLKTAREGTSKNQLMQTMKRLEGKLTCVRRTCWFRGYS